ncbi:MAG: hypothetical protein ABUL71_02900 [Gemmatimonadota bacterium]
MNRSISTVAAALMLAACSAQATTAPSVSGTPTSGWLTLQLTTPHSDDGAVQLSIVGPAIDSVKILTYDGFEAHSATVADLVATGTITSGDVARVHIPDLSRTTEYHASVSAAAARDSYALQALDGYRAVLVR